MFGCIHIIAVVQLVSLVAAATDPPKLRIVGGIEASSLIPYQASFQDKNGHFCGGYMISSRAIVTAGHCIYGQVASEMVVVVGTNQLSSGGYTYRLSALHLHPKFDFESGAHDSGVAITSVNIVPNDHVQIGKLYTQYVGPGSNALAVGWGSNLTTGDGMQQDKLQTLAVKTVDCTSGDDSKVCALSTDKDGAYGHGLCFGDSGSALMKPDTFELFGTVHGGEPCALGYEDEWQRVDMEFLSPYLDDSEPAPQAPQAKPKQKKSSRRWRRWSRIFDE